MRILGLDPGSLHTGYGVVERQGSALRALAGGRISCPRSQSLAMRLAHLARELDGLVERWRPGMAVMEGLFHHRNSRSLIALAEARGALLSVLAQRGLEIWEYSPSEVKQAVTGSGRADKGQVARMVQLLLALGPEPLPADATDALAVAICGAQRRKLDRLQGRKGGSPEPPK